MSTKPFATLAAAVALGLAVSAQASPTEVPSSQADQRSVRVSIADLDLSKDATVARQRILRAAGLICGEETHQSGLSRYIIYRACVNATASDAVATLDAQIAAGTPDRTIVVSRR